MNSGKICVSVCAGTLPEMLKSYRQARSFADIVELRLDCLDPDELYKFTLPEGTFILTLRPLDQGGSSRLSAEERKRFWARVGPGAGADMEADIPDAEGASKFDPLICSFHDFSGQPKAISASYDAVASSNAPVLKIAVAVSDATDAVPVWKLLDHAKREGRRNYPDRYGRGG